MVTDIINTLHIGDARIIIPTLPKKSIQTVITSPPYFKLRDYGINGQIGQEETVEDYIYNLVDVFHKIKHVLKDDGTLWLKPKDLIGVPWRVAFALQKDGWYLRQDIIWHKPNAMPEAVKDRCTKSHEYIFLLSKSKSYYFNAEAIKEDSVTFENRLPAIVRNREYSHASKLNATHPSYNLRRDDKRDPFKQKKPQKRLNRKDSDYDITKRNKRDVWTIPTRPYKGAHFATFPLKLVIPCILAGSREEDVILDPFFGSGTVAEAARFFNRNWIGIELNPKYKDLYKKRLGLFDYTNK